MSEIEVLVSENNKKLAFKRIPSFFKKFGFFPKALLKFFILFIFGFTILDKIKFNFFKIYNFIIKNNTNEAESRLRR